MNGERASISAGGYPSASRSKRVVLLVGISLALLLTLTRMMAEALRRLLGAIT